MERRIIAEIMGTPPAFLKWNEIEYYVPSVLKKIWGLFASVCFYKRIWHTYFFSLLFVIK